MNDGSLKILRGIASQIESLDKQIQELTELMMSLSQQIKHMHFLIVGTAVEPQVPAGERDTAECEQCGRRAKKRDLMAKHNAERGDIVIRNVCKACFYGRRKTFGKITP